MAKTTKKQAETKPQQALPFEEALRLLESLVKSMESEQATLDDLIRNYEEGIALFQVCQARIDEAQGRIEKIRKKRDGSIVLEELGGPGGPVETIEQQEPGNDLSGLGNSTSKARPSVAGDPANQHGELY